MFRQPVEEVHWVAFDTETTGLKKHSRLVEISGLRFCGQDLKDGFSTLVDPEVKIPAKAVEIHGITNEMVRGKPKSYQVLPKFFQFAKEAILLAHNLPYDLGILEGELQRHNLPLEEKSLWGVDTLVLAKMWLPGLSSYRLSAVARYLGIGYRTLHRASADTFLVMQIFHKVVQKVGEKLGKSPTLLELTQGKGCYLFPPLRRVDEKESKEQKMA